MARHSRRLVVVNPMEHPMDSPTEKVPLPGRMLLLGFGALGQGVLPLLFRHLDLRPTQVVACAPDPSGRALAVEYGIGFEVAALTRDNYGDFLSARLAPGDFLVNLSVDVSSVALIAFCQQHGVLYIDTCIEPWADAYVDAARSVAERSNYALREAALALNANSGQRRGPTAVLTHGANPGLVSHLVKQALMDIARDHELKVAPPESRGDWAALARRLGIQAIHIAERDTQQAEPRRVAGEFVNTWSVDGFAGEGRQPSELGWGSHERHFPADAHRHTGGCGAAIYLERPGFATQLRSWTPSHGAMHAFLVTHGESISIADYLTIGPPESPQYRPTVCYAYHPCDDALLSIQELAGRNWVMPTRKRVVKDEIVSGFDELGVLLMGHGSGAYWYGSRLGIDEVRRLCPHNSATTLQVAVSVVAAIAWALRNPAQGIVDPEALPYDFVLAFARPYLGEMLGVYSQWTPLQGRGLLFPEDTDTRDSWQFKNFRVA